MQKNTYCLIFILFLTPLIVNAESNNPSNNDRMRDVLNIINDTQAMYPGDIFSDRLVRAVEPTQLVDVMKKIKTEYGMCAVLASTENRPQTSYLLTCGDHIVPADISIQTTPPYKIDGIFFRQAYKMKKK